MQIWLQRFNALDDAIANLLHTCNPLEYLRGARIAYLASFLVMLVCTFLLYKNAVYSFKLYTQYPTFGPEILLMAAQPLWWQIGILLLSSCIFQRAQLFLDYISWGTLIDQHNVKEK